MGSHTVYRPKGEDVDMTLTILSRGRDGRRDESADIDWIALLKTGTVHYVGIARPGLTVISFCVEFAAGMSISERNRLMMTVNQRQEVGTLYPRANISLLPSPTASYIGEPETQHHAGYFSRSEIELQIRDVFKAHTEYIKCPQLYFDVRNTVYNQKDYIRALRKVIDATPVQQLPKEIITWHPH